MPGPECLEHFGVRRKFFDEHQQTLNLFLWFITGQSARAAPCGECSVKISSEGEAVIKKGAVREHFRGGGDDPTAVSDYAIKRSDSGHRLPDGAYELLRLRHDPEIRLWRFPALRITLLRLLIRH